MQQHHSVCGHPIGGGSVLHGLVALVGLCQDSMELQAKGKVVSEAEVAFRLQSGGWEVWTVCAAHSPEQAEEGRREGRRKIVLQCIMGCYVL